MDKISHSFGQTLQFQMERMCFSMRPEKCFDRFFRVKALRRFQQGVDTCSNIVFREILLTPLMVPLLLQQEI